MAAMQEAREVDWAAVAAPIAVVAPWRPGAEPGQADPHEAGWAGRGFTRPGPEPDTGYQAGYAPEDTEMHAGMVTISDGSAAALTGPRRAQRPPPTDRS
jgi:hypothetical protein